MNALSVHPHRPMNGSTMGRRGSAWAGTLALAVGLAAVLATWPAQAVVVSGPLAGGAHPVLLSAPAGHLVSGLGALPGLADEASASFNFSTRDAAAGMRPASRRLDAVATPVVEPAVWLTTLIGLVGLVIHLWRRHARRGDEVPPPSPSRPRPYLMRHPHPRRHGGAVAPHMRRLDTAPAPLEIEVSEWRPPP